MPVPPVVPDRVELVAAGSRVVAVSLTSGLGSSSRVAPVELPDEAYLRELGDLNLKRPADIVAFAGLSGDYNQLHVDQQFAEKTIHGGRIAHGMLVLSILSGLSTRTPLMQGLGETIVGLVNLECRFRKATRIGDTIRVRLTVAELKPTSKGGRGIVVLNREAINQADEVVLESVWSLMVRTRAGGATA